MTAILGPSGAGKASLLNLLCKRIIPSKSNIITGKIIANNLEYSYEQFPLFSGYVMQDDRLFATLTVRESLEFAANLKVDGTK